jgi:hypothetical protein
VHLGEDLFGVALERGGADQLVGADLAQRQDAGGPADDADAADGDGD